MKKKEQIQKYSYWLLYCSSFIYKFHSKYSLSYTGNTTNINVILPFLFSSKCSLMSLEAYSLIHGLCRIVSLNFQMLRDLPVIALLLISSIISLWSKNKLCVISVTLKSIKICFMTLDMVYLGECFMCTENIIYSAIAGWNVL